MRLATFNINNVVSRLPQLVAWLDVTKPDVVCLQEIKTTQSAFPTDALRKAGYSSLVYGQKTWNGVAILARGAEPIEVRRGLPGDVDDTQARYLEAAVQGVIVGSLYLPNGNPQPGPKFDYKLAWFERLHHHAASLLKTGHPVLLAGDYNVVPTDDDIYDTRSWKDNALLHPAARAAFRKLLKQGWSDVVRELSPEQPPYTFWSYLRNRWPRDAGMRIDHILASPSLRHRVVAAGVDRAVRGLEGSSDHAPVWVELKG
ncbi:MAG: exodeoxyribonuclease III [Comamonadaceae bacterium]|nr:MAG: exodeoxyribonuclease III [Comamonadaceae bacterium]